MEKYMVLYRQSEVMTELDDPFGFECMADDPDHAEEQCLNAYGDGDIVWVGLNQSYKEALDDYYFNDKYLYDNDELIDIMTNSGLSYSTIDNLWKADTDSMLRFIGKIENIYVRHYESVLKDMKGTSNAL
jgi:hypothetical protein